MAAEALPSCRPQPARCGAVRTCPSTPASMLPQGDLTSVDRTPLLPTATAMGKLPKTRSAGFSENGLGGLPAGSADDDSHVPNPLSPAYAPFCAQRLRTTFFVNLVRGWHTYCCGGQTVRSATPPTCLLMPCMPQAWLLAARVTQVSIMERMDEQVQLAGAVVWRLACISIPVWIPPALCANRQAVAGQCISPLADVGLGPNCAAARAARRAPLRGCRPW